MFRKIVSLFVLVGVLLAGCSKAATPTEEPVAVEPTKEAVEEPTKEPETPAEVVTLDYYIMGTDPTNRATVEAEINAYLEPLIGAKVAFHFVGWGDWASKTITGVQAGEKMDVVFVADWYFYMQLVTEGLLTPLNDDDGPNGNLLAQYGQGITSSLNPAFLTGSAIDGVNYAIPTNKELSVPWGFLYNATIADEIGFTDEEAAKVKNMKDLEPWVAKAKEAHPDMYPYLTDGGIGFMPYVHAFATNVSNWVINTNAIPDANGKVDESIFVPFETPWMKDYLAIVRDWYVKGYIHPDAGLTTFDTTQVLNAGNFFIEPMPLKGNGIKAAEMMNASGNADLKLKELYGMPKVINTSDAGGSMLAIPASSQYPVQAMKLLNLMHSDKKLLNMMVFGVEGTNWSLDPDGRVNVIDDTWLKAHPGPWVWADVTLQYVTNQQDPETNQMLIDYAKDAFPEPSLGFRFRTEPVAAEITALTAVVDGSQRALLTGYVDPEVELPKFIQAMKDAGLDKVLAEVQKQYDAWKAAKGQ